MFKSRMLIVLAALFVCSRAIAADPPTDWIDPDTGHRIVRLSTEPDSVSLYFNQNGYTADGQRVIITSPTGLYTINLATRQIEQIAKGALKVIVAGRKSGQVYYSQGQTIFAADVNTHAIHKIATLPFKGGMVVTINADETLLAGAMLEGDAAIAGAADFGPQVTGAYVAPTTLGPDGKPLNIADAKEVRMDHRLNQRLPMALFTVNTATGEIKTFNHSTDWLGHVQFSPTDPTLLMFCHEGPWHKVDRIWTIRTDGSDATLIHHRTMLMEIAGHEFWAADGHTIWYDLQTPRGEDFWVAGLNLPTQQRTYYHLQRDEWSVHFNVSPDGALFAGDGGDADMVAHAKDGKWIYLFRPELTPNIAGLVPDQKNLIQPGKFRSERLVNMAKHDYKLEPNVSFTPDMKWLVFRTNMFGPTCVLAVEIARH